MTEVCLGGWPDYFIPESFLDSLGVQRATFEGNNLKDSKRYKLFFDATFRRVVLGRLEKQFVEAGFCARKPRVTLGLAAGKIKGDEAWLERYFAKHGWCFWGPTEVRAELITRRSEAQASLECIHDIGEFLVDSFTCMIRSLWTFLSFCTIPDGHRISTSSAILAAPRPKCIGPALEEAYPDAVVT